MDRLTQEEVARARGLLAQALPPRPEPAPAPEPQPAPLDPRRAAEKACIQEHVDRIVAEAPPLTDEQMARITELLRPTLRRSA